MAKKLAKEYHVCLASESLINQVAPVLAPGLSKFGKLPPSCPGEHVTKITLTTKFHTNTVLHWAFASGHNKVTEEELVFNIHLAATPLVSQLKKSQLNVCALHIKSRMLEP
ncbi:large ribosomal subunit protein uL1-like [Stegostoma tigrinum]|uniref:large ribosomal subunit protein uL1-like n=1 Tax=Stegostoma tigrinum TaxID=3053191 RepID=UPI00202B2770|nr:large ribosomal subunit protein uL1-like [Stegostoma tigrinum]